jgi:CelD/BcsL family acetyltransferase involved in cellulose biosynthesis
MIRPLLECYGGSAMLYASCQDGSQPLALAILTRSAANRWTIFSPSQAPLSALLTPPSLALATLARSLLRALPGYALTLDISARDPQLRGESPPDAQSQNAPLGTTISVAANAGFNGYWESRSKDLRKNVKRYFHRATEAQLPWQLRRISEPHEIGAAVDRYGMLESSGWKGREGTALHPQNAQGALYRQVMQGFAAANNGSVYELYLGEQLAASRLIVRGPTMHVILKTTYSEDLKQYAPGRLLLYLILQQLLDQGSVPVEFYTRANDDLLSWATAKRELFATTVFRNGAVVFAASARRLLRSRLAARTPAAQAPESSESKVESRSAAARRE